MAKTYGTYKDSGIAWIGKFPSDWNLVRLGKIGFFTASGIDKKSNDNERPIHIINYTDVYGNESHELRQKEYMLVTAPEDKCKEHQVIEGDMIFTPSSETIEDIGLSAVVMQNLPNTAYSYHVLRFRSSKIDKNFKKYICNNLFVQNYFSSKATGSIRKTLCRQDFKDCLVLLPPLSEQQSIASFLDEKCGEIDELVSLQEQMISELQAYKMSVITEAVTKGLNQNVPMKDSGVEWIGMIPEGWGVTKFKNLFQIKKDIAGRTGLDVLSVTQKGLKIKDLSKNEGQLAKDYSNYQLVHKKDFVMNHMDLLTGFVDLSVYEGVTSPDYRTFKTKDYSLVDNHYYLKIFQICYWTRLFYNLGQGVSNLGRWRLPAEQQKEFMLPLPPLSEQKEIAVYLDEKTAQIDSLIAIKQEKIAELKDYKKSIIYEYVTGKKKV